MSAASDRENPGTVLPRLVARVVCHFSDGETRTLYATRFSLVDADILAMRLPRAGETVRLVIHPRGLSPLGTIDGRIVATRLDPADAANSGFRVVFTRFGQHMLDGLYRAVTALGLPCDPPGEQLPVEKRDFPRIWGDLAATVETPEGQRKMSLRNLSMSGALIAAGDSGLPAGICPGALLRCHLVKPDAPEIVEVKVEVVRVGKEEGEAVFGVRFIDLDPVTAARIEGLVLHLLGGFEE